jgi:hypothetical protein
MSMKERYEKILPGARLWTGEMEVDQGALDQIRKVTQLPILAGHVAVMPDVHLGKGATVGTVIPTRAAIVPAAVGVDYEELSILDPVGKFDEGRGEAKRRFTRDRLKGRATLSAGANRCYTRC